MNSGAKTLQMMRNEKFFIHIISNGRYQSAIEKAFRTKKNIGQFRANRRKDQLKWKYNDNELAGYLRVRL